jgi:hypothetical protein
VSVRKQRTYERETLKQNLWLIRILFFKVNRFVRSKRLEISRLEELRQTMQTLPVSSSRGLVQGFQWIGHSAWCKASDGYKIKPVVPNTAGSKVRASESSGTRSSDPSLSCSQAGVEMKEFVG